MWVLDGELMRPLLPQPDQPPPLHSRQYQALPPVYTQNSALEIAWTRVVAATGSREGRVVTPFLTSGYEGFNVDDEEDWRRAEELVAQGFVALPRVDPPYPPAR
jgi:N-acylneuraminate cytidylyltransferase